MKSSLIGIILALASAVYADNTNRPAQSDDYASIRMAKARYPRFPLFVGPRDDKAPVWIMERLESDALHDLFPNHTVFRLISGRDYQEYSFSALLLDTNGSPTCLQSDKEVAKFLTDLTVWEHVTSTSNALLLVRAFAALRSYKIAEKEPDFKDVRQPTNQPPALATDFKFVATGNEDGWTVYATFITCDDACYERYVFTIYKHPGAGFHFSDPVLIRLRGYKF